MQRLLPKTLMALLIAAQFPLAGLSLTVPGAAQGAPASVTSKAVMDDPQSLFEQGVYLYRSGQLDQALTLFRGFGVQHADSPLRNKAYLYLARIFLDYERFGEAASYLERIPERDWGPEEQFIKGVTQIETGQPQQGVARLLPLQNGPLFEEDRIRLYLSLAKGQTKLNRPLQALMLLDQSFELGKKQSEVLKRAHHLLSEQLSDTELSEAAFMFTDTAIGQDASLQLARRAMKRGDREAAQRLSQQVVDTPVAFPYRSEAIELLTRLSGTSWLNSDTIGVILPLSGRYAPFGELVKRGLELAAGGDSPPVQFVYRDSAADPQKAAAAVTDLASKERVIAIIGPLSGNAASAAAERAQLEGVPMLTLSHKGELPQIGDYIFRNSLTSRMQARALARHAVLTQGITSFGVLAPATRLGEELTEVFHQEVKKLGGLVVDVEHYAEDATDFRSPVLLLRGKDPATYDEEEEAMKAEEGQENPSIEDEPELDPAPFQALFIPDFAERVALIAPQLAFYGLDNIQLLGINGWNSPELLRTAAKFVEGAVLVEGFFAYSSFPFVTDFVNRYFEAYGVEPTLLEAQAFDSAGIILSLLNAGQIKSRDSLRLALSQLKNYPGVTGATSFDLQGEADKILFLLRIEHGNFVQID